MTTLDKLYQLRVLLADPESWCRGSPARTEEGCDTYADDPEATQWCLIGGILKVTNGAGEPLMSLLQGELGVGDGLSTFNDTSEHRDVLELIDKAIRREEERVV